MHIPSADFQTHERIKRLVADLVYAGSRDTEQVRALLRETYPYEHLTIKRNSLLRWVEKYEQYKRESKRAEAWGRVSDLLYELGTELLSLSRTRIERDGTIVQ